MCLFTFLFEKLQAGVDLLTFLTETNIFPSKGEAKKMLQNNGVSINRKKVGDMNMQITTAILIHEKYLLIQKGKKNYYLVEVVS